MFMKILQQINEASLWQGLEISTYYWHYLTLVKIEWKWYIEQIVTKNYIKIEF